MVSCQKGPTRHAYTWQIGPFRQDTLEVWNYLPLIQCRSVFIARKQEKCRMTTQAVSLYCVKTYNFFAFVWYKQFLWDQNEYAY